MSRKVKATTHELKEGFVVKLRIGAFGVILIRERELTEVIDQLEEQRFHIDDIENARETNGYYEKG